MRLPLVLAGAACLASAIVIGPWPEDRTAMGRLQRLAGPLGSVAASTQWMRFTLANRSDDGERALGIGRSALGMDPLAPDGWQLLAHHLVFERGSDAESAGTRGRRVWIEAGLDLLEQGATASREPGVTARASRRQFRIAFCQELLRIGRFWVSLRVCIDCEAF